MESWRNTFFSNKNNFYSNSSSGKNNGVYVVSIWDNPEKHVRQIEKIYNKQAEELGISVDLLKRINHKLLNKALSPLSKSYNPENTCLDDFFINIVEKEISEDMEYLKRKGHKLLDKIYNFYNRYFN